MAIELTKEDRAQAIASIERYFRENMEEKIGNVAASGLLGFILEEIGPSIYNKAVVDAQERLQARVTFAQADLQQLAALRSEALFTFRRNTVGAKVIPAPD
jgi:uncharacterized protein (DUF2164 family)